MSDPGQISFRSAVGQQGLAICESSLSQSCSDSSAYLPHNSHFGPAFNTCVHFQLPKQRQKKLSDVDARQMYMFRWSFKGHQSGLLIITQVNTGALLTRRSPPPSFF